MLTSDVAVISAVDSANDRVQIATAIYECDGRETRCLNYCELNPEMTAGDRVLLNTTAQTLELGTGGLDFVITNLTKPIRKQSGDVGHIVKMRYTPHQLAVTALEQNEEYAHIWSRSLQNLPVVIGQLHSQLLPAAAGLKASGALRVGYIMTDSAALCMDFSDIVRTAKQHEIVDVTYTPGQAWGGDFETVTIHSALLGARHIHNVDAVVICQGPGNVGTGTKYGFGGVEMAHIIDIVNQLGGSPFAIARCSNADTRERHTGISHHTITALELACTGAVVALPAEVQNCGQIPSHHTVVSIEGAAQVLDVLTGKGIDIRSMGRNYSLDPVFFHAAAAAGLAARELFKIANV